MLPHPTPRIGKESRAEDYLSYQLLNLFHYGGTFHINYNMEFIPIDFQSKKLVTPLANIEESD